MALTDGSMPKLLPIRKQADDFPPVLIRRRVSASSSEDSSLPSGVQTQKKAPFGIRFLISSASLVRPAWISAAVGFGVLGMIFVERSGTFDVVNYGFYRLFESFRLDRKKKWDNAGDYKEEKQKKRHASKAAYWPCLAVSGFFLTMAILFTILYFAL